MNLNPKPRTALTLFALLALLSLVAACTQLGAPGPANPTVEAIGAALEKTLTQRAQQDESEGELATAQAQATSDSLAIFATQTAQVSGRDEQALATATVTAPIVAELPSYGLDTNSGHAAWLQGPVSLEVNQYHEMKYANERMEITAADFVLAADITWKTKGGSGCGFMFRSNGDTNKPSQYMVVISRFATGRALWTAINEGELANIYDIFPASFDKGFKDGDEQTNRLAIVARGNIIQIYTNGTLIGEIDTTQPPKQPTVPSKPTQPLPGAAQAEVDRYQAELANYNDLVEQSRSNYQVALTNFKNKPAVFTDGFLAMIALNESGDTTCTFDKAWLWLLD